MDIFPLPTILVLYMMIDNDRDVQSFLVILLITCQSSVTEVDTSQIRFLCVSAQSGIFVTCHPYQSRDFITLPPGSTSQIILTSSRDKMVMKIYHENRVQSGSPGIIIDILTVY